MLLAAAGVSKLVSPRPAQRMLITAGLPAPLFAIRALAACELAIGAAAVIAPSRACVLAVGAAYAAFCVLTVRLLRRARTGVGCGCFGSEGADVTGVHLALNLAALVVCVLAASAPPQGLAALVSHSPLPGMLTCLGVGAAAYALFLAFTAFPRAWSAYGTGTPR